MLTDGQKFELLCRTRAMKRFCSYIKSVRKDNSVVTPLNVYRFTGQVEHTQQTTCESTRGPVGPGWISFTKKINPGKVTVPDDPIIILRDLTEDLPPFLTIFFQRKLILREVQTDCHSAKVTAFYVKGDKFKTGHLLQHKEHIGPVILSKPMDYLEQHSTPTDCQYGLRIL